MKLALVLTLLLNVGSALALAVKFATVAPAGTPWADSLDQIKTRVEKESNKKIKIKTYLGGQLGGELEILQGIRRGRIQGGGLTSGALASVIPELDVLELPYIFESSEEADFILDNYLLSYFKELFDAKGLVLVSWAENGWRNIGHKSKAIKTPADLKSVKVRSQESKAHLAFWNKLDASPVAIAIPEVLPSLQTGVVQGFDNTPLFTLAAEWHTAIKHFTLTNHIYQPAAVVFSKKLWKKLSEKDRKTLMGPGNAMAPGSRAAVRALGDELIDVLKSSGIKVYNLSKKEKASFKASIKDLDKDVIKKIGGKAEEVYKLIQKGKKAFADSHKV